MSGYLERSLVLNLSPEEFDENDCKTSFGLVITITCKDHALSLINKYYGNIKPNTKTEAGIAIVDGDWKLFTEKDANESINKTFVFRSPITCQTKNFKICRKCFGEINIQSPFIGIITGQSIAERLTQLSMRTFHTSGSSSLPTDSNIVKFMEKHLITIDNHPEKNFCIIIFDSNIPDDIYIRLQTIPGYIQYKFINTIDSDIYKKYLNDENKVIAYINVNKVENQDVTFKIKELNELLLKIKPTKSNDLNISNIYSQFINVILELGLIYSSFIEIIFANMFVKDRIPIRYLLSLNPNVMPDTKLNLKQIHTIVSKLLGLLYEPNSVSLSTFSNPNYVLQDDANTIFERLWKGMI